MLTKFLFLRCQENYRRWFIIRVGIHRIGRVEGIQKINESIDIQKKERSHRYNVVPVGKDSILQSQDCAGAMLSMKDSNGIFLVCVRFFHPSLYFERRCTF